MTINQNFSERYEALQHQWRQRAKEHGHHYLKYLAPREPANFVLVGKMTSISERDAAGTEPGCYPAVAPPHFNLLLSLGDLILNYGAHEHLCKQDETYYLTDLGKCARPPKQAKGRKQDDEFNYWYPTFLEELKLVAKPDATVIPVGAATGNFLKLKKGESEFCYRLTEPILHWSSAANVAAKMASSFFPDEWKDFSEATSWDKLRESTEEILTDAGLSQHMDDIDRRYRERFGKMQTHLMFTYKKEMLLRRSDMGQA